MLPCKDATQLISQSMDTSLSIVKRIRLRLHLRICEWCARYERQLLLIRETLRRLYAAGDRPEGRAGETLSEDARERIKKSLRNP